MFDVVIKEILKVLIKRNRDYDKMYIFIILINYFLIYACSLEICFAL